VTQKPSKVDPRTIILVTFVAMGRLCIHHSIYYGLATFSGAGVVPFSIIFFTKRVLETDPRKKNADGCFLSIFDRKCSKMMSPGGMRKSFLDVFFPLGRLLGPKVSPESPQVTPKGQKTSETSLKGIKIDPTSFKIV
jgi:hypothetical protein